MSRHFVVDASIWVSRFVPQDQFHHLCKDWLNEQVNNGGTLISPSFVLVEIAGAISRRTGDASLAQQAVDQMSKVPGVRLVDVDAVLIQGATKLAADLGLRGADAIYAATAHRLDLSLVTLDLKQANRSAESVKAVVLK